MIDTFWAFKNESWNLYFLTFEILAFLVLWPFPRICFFWCGSVDKKNFDIFFNKTFDLQKKIRFQITNKQNAGNPKNCGGDLES